MVADRLIRTRSLLTGTGGEGRGPFTGRLADRFEGAANRAVGAREGGPTPNLPRQDRHLGRRGPVSVGLAVRCQWNVTTFDTFKEAVVKGPVC